MKVIAIVFSILYFATSTFASEKIILGTSTVLESNILKEERPYLVYLPPSYHSSKNFIPVIYLLDGEFIDLKGSLVY